jgi:hypothetical protein
MIFGAAVKALATLGVLAISAAPSSFSLLAGEDGYRASKRTGTMTASSQDPSQPRRSPKLPLPRDPDVAVREEFQLARTQGTIEAMENFLARHGDHPLADQARRELRKLQDVK